MIVAECQQETLGFEPIADLSSVVRLPSPPPKAAYALIQAYTKAIRWRDDGTDPTATVGHLIPAGKTYRYLGNLLKIRLIEQEASATASVTFYEPI